MKTRTPIKQMPTSADAQSARDMFSNREKLIACKGHVWTEEGPAFRCTVCTGLASAQLRAIYEQGKRHASKP